MQCNTMQHIAMQCSAILYNTINFINVGVLATRGKDLSILACKYGRLSSQSLRGGSRRRLY